METQPLFRSGELDAVLSSAIANMKSAIENADPSKLQQGNIEELVEEFVRSARVQPLELQENGITKDQRPTKVDVSRRFEYAWDGGAPLLVDGVEVSLHVPFAGDPSLFRLRPSRWSSNLPYGSVTGREVVLRESGPPQDADRIKAELERTLESLKQHVNWSRSQIASHNASLEGTARAAIEQRRARLGNMPDIASSLPYPPRSK